MLSSHYTVKARLVLLVLVINLFATGAFTVFAYNQQKTTVLAELDTKLKAGALSVELFLGRNFHDRYRSADALSPAQHLAYLKQLSAHAAELGLSYIYAMTRTGDTVRFTASSATAEELAEQDYDEFFAPYADASPELLAAFDNQQAFTEEARDEYGYFRSLILPRTSPGGVSYVIGADIDMATVQSRLSGVLWRCLGLGLCVLLVSLGLSFILMQRVSAAINRLLNRMEGITGSRDLSQRVPVEQDDEIGQIATVFNNFLNSIQTVLREVDQASTAVIQTAQELDLSSQDLAGRNAGQAEAMRYTAQTLKRLSEKISDNNQEAGHMDRAIGEFNSGVRDKQGLIKDVSATMQSIGASSSQIAQIVEVIGDISFRTNLLALNAAVEAARAGEAGQGFAVVAGEVRALARRAAESSQLIKNITSDNQNSTLRGVDLTRATASFFESLLGDLAKLVAKLENLVAGFEEEKQGVEQINGMVAESQNVIASNAGLSESLAASSARLNRHANQLGELIASFRLN